MIRRWLAALLALGCRSVRIAGNVVDQIQLSEDEPFVAAGIASDLGFDRVDVLDNSVRAAERREDGQPRPESVALIIGELPGRRMVFEIDSKLYLISPTAVLDLGISSLGRLTAVRGNLLEAVGGPTALVATMGVCTFAENHCRLEPSGEGGGSTAAVQLGVQTLVLGGNQIAAPEAESAVAVDADVGGTTILGEPAITALGNITAGEIRVNTATLQAPWAPLNIRLS